ncbi:hypothetical protein ZWY2020_057475 [Hordeum vulgare]|nr:hypothetical protein ZWY2020_057475 [Hordeum vulgare]
MRPRRPTPPRHHHLPPAPTPTTTYPPAGDHEGGHDHRGTTPHLTPARHASHLTSHPRHSPTQVRRPTRLNNYRCSQSTKVVVLPQATAAPPLSRPPRCPGDILLRRGCQIHNHHYPTPPR